MTLGELREQGMRDPVEVRAGRRRAVLRMLARITRQQVLRERLELGQLDLGGEA